MTFTIRIRGDHTAPISQDFACYDCGPFSALTSRDDDTAPCPDCDNPAEWVMSAPHGSVRLAEVVRGGVAKADSPMFLDTRPLAEGMSMTEWKAKREKLQIERRHAERKKLFG